MFLTNFIIILVVCFLVWILFFVYGLYQKTVVLRRKSAVLLVRTIKSQNKFLRKLKITNTSLKGIIICREVLKIIETMKLVSYFVCLVFKKR